MRSPALLSGGVRGLTRVQAGEVLTAALPVTAKDLKLMASSVFGVLKRSCVCTFFLWMAEVLRQPQGASTKGPASSS